MTKKVICVILIVYAIISLVLCNSKVYAVDTLDGVIDGANSFLNLEGKDKVANIDDGKLKSMSSMVFNALLAIGLVVAVIVGMVIGIKLMMAGIDEKAKVKEALVPYVISCIVVFGAFGIWKLAVTIVSGW